MFLCVYIYIYLHTAARACACPRVALLNQHEKRMHQIVVSIVPTLAGLYFSTLSYKRHDFLERAMDHKMCFDFLYNFY
jgi:hypothetical protein